LALFWFLCFGGGCVAKDGRLASQPSRRVGQVAKAGKDHRRPGFLVPPATLNVLQKARAGGRVPDR